MDDNFGSFRDPGTGTGRDFKLVEAAPGALLGPPRLGLSRVRVHQPTRSIMMRGRKIMMGRATVSVTDGRVFTNPEVAGVQ